jgi:hypothetical protein
MKKLILVFVAISFMVLTLNAQKTLLADYPLQTDGNDATGLNEAMTLTNVAFQDGGIYCNGIYVNSEEENSYEATSPVINNFNFKSFTIEVDFFVTENLSEPVIVCGSGCRWLGFYLNDDFTVDLFYNNGNRQPCELAYTANEWHNLRISYDGTTASAFLDNVLAGSALVTLEYDVCGDTDTNIGTTNYGSGEAFRGYIRNFKVFTGQ